VGKKESASTWRKVAVLMFLGAITILLTLLFTNASTDYVHKVNVELGNYRDLSQQTLNAYNSSPSEQAYQLYISTEASRTSSQIQATLADSQMKLGWTQQALVIALLALTTYQAVVIRKFKS
jgi:hypothetical protein